MQVARYSAPGHDIHSTADNHGHDASCLQGPGRQTDGLMADGSQRNQQRNVHLIFNAGVDNRWRIFVDGGAMTVLRGDKMITRREAADTALFCKLRQDLEREVALAIVGVR